MSLKMQPGKVYLRDKRNGRVYEYESNLASMSYIEAFTPQEEKKEEVPATPPKPNVPATPPKPATPAKVATKVATKTVTKVAAKKVPARPNT